MAPSCLVEVSALSELLVCKIQVFLFLLLDKKKLREWVDGGQFRRVVREKHGLRLTLGQVLQFITFNPIQGPNETDRCAKGIKPQRILFLLLHPLLLVINSPA